MLKIWLPLNGDLHNQGLADVTVTNNGATVNDAGKIGKCYSFNGSNNKIVGALSTPITSSIGSLSCWFKINSLPSSSGFYNLIQLGNLGGYATCLLGIYLEYNTRITVSINGSSTNSNSYTHSLENNKWYHICATFNGEIVKLFLNGEEVLSKSAIVGSYATASYLYCGGTSSYYLNGYLNDVKYFDHCLSPKEIKELSKGLVLHYPLNRGGFGGDNIIAGSSSIEKQYTYPASSYKDWYAPTTTIIPTGTQYILSFYAKSTVNGDKIRTHFYSPNTTTTCVSSQGVTKTASDGSMDFTLSTEWKCYWVIYTQTETTAVKHVICPRLVSGQGTGTVSMKYVKLEEGSTPTPWIPNSADTLYSTMGLDSNIEYDVSGYQNNGTTSNLTYNSNTARYNVATVFNNNSNIKNTNFTFTSGVWSVSFWYYFNTLPSGYQCFFCLSRGNGADANKKIAACPNSSYIWFKLESASQSVNSIKKDEWVHIAMTSDGTIGKVYENGVLKYSTSVRNIFTDCDDLVVGARANASNATSIAVPLSGNMSDFRIYATTLSADDVLELYHTPASIANNGVLMTQGEISEV